MVIAQSKNRLKKEAVFIYKSVMFSFIVYHSTSRKAPLFGTYCEQENAAEFNPPGLFLFGVEVSPAKTYLLDKLFEKGQK